MSNSILDKKKCVFIINNLDSGGIENYLLRFLNHYDGKIIPTVICKGNAFGDLESEYRKITSIVLVKLKIGYFDLKGFYNLYNFLKKGNYNTVVDFTGNFGAFPLLMAKYANIKQRIVFYRGATNHFDETFIKKLYNNFLNNVIKKVATSILSNSTTALNFFFENRKDSRFEVIYNGINAEKFLDSKINLRKSLNIPADGFVISHVGRFTKAKNHKTIIKTAIRLCKENEKIYFILCGRDVNFKLKELVESERLSGKIKLLGYRKDVISVLNSSNAFYFPSLTEGQPNALIEALIVGLPFVASNIEPIKETIPSAFHSYLVDPDDVSGAVLKFEKLFQSSELRNQLNLSFWATKNYEPNNLFNKFYIKL